MCQFIEELRRGESVSSQLFKCPYQSSRERVRPWFRGSLFSTSGSEELERPMGPTASCPNVPPQVSGSATIEDDENVPPGVFDQVLSSVPYYFVQLLLPLAVVMFWIATPGSRISTAKYRKDYPALTLRVADHPEHYPELHDQRSRQ